MLDYIDDDNKCDDDDDDDDDKNNNSKKITTMTTKTTKMKKTTMKTTRKKTTTAKRTKENFLIYLVNFPHTLRSLVVFSMKDFSPLFLLKSLYINTKTLSSKTKTVIYIYI